MFKKEIFKCRDKKLYIMNTFILVWRIGFLLNNNIRMRSHKIFIVKRNMPNDSKTIGNNTKLKDIAKMILDIKLFNLWICNCMWRHRTISSFIRIIMIVKVISFCIGFKLLNDSVCILGIALSDKGFNTRRINDRHIRFCRIYSSTDWHG